MANHLMVFMHLVWATDGRRPLLHPRLEAGVHELIRTKCRQLRCTVLAVGGMPDHVHLLVELHPTVSLSNLVKEVKGASSHAATHLHRAGPSFRWQTGYGAFSVSHRDVPRATAYVLRQKEHPASGTLSPALEALPLPSTVALPR